MTIKMEIFDKFQGPISLDEFIYSWMERLQLIIEEGNLDDRNEAISNMFKALRFHTGERPYEMINRINYSDSSFEKAIFSQLAGGVKISRYHLVLLFLSLVDASNNSFDIESTVGRQRVNALWDLMSHTPVEYDKRNCLLGLQFLTHLIEEDSVSR